MQRAGDQQAAVEPQRQRAHPERAPHVAAVGQAEQAGPGDRQQQAAEHVAGPVGAEVQPREGQQGQQEAGQHIGPGAAAAGHLAGDQHGEEAVDQGGVGDRRGGEAEAAARHRRWRGGIQQAADQLGGDDAETDCGQPMDRAQPAPPAQQPEQGDQHRRPQRLPVAQGREAGHEVIGKGRAQAQHELLDRQVQRQGLAAAKHVEGQPAEPHRGGQQGRAEQQQRGRFRLVGIDQRAGEAAKHGMPVRPVEPGLDQPGRTRREKAVDLDHQPVDQRQRGGQCEQHEAEPAGDRTDQLHRGAEQPARRQEDHRPGGRGDRAGRRVDAATHAQHAGDGRHEGADGADVAGDQQPLHPVLGEHHLARGQPLRVARKRPHAPQAVAITTAEHIADAVAAEGAEGGADDGVQRVDRAEANQRADGEEDRDQGHGGAHQQQGVAEGDGKDRCAGGHRMRGDPGHQGIQLG
jgi:hypothetical protein